MKNELKLQDVTIEISDLAQFLITAHVDKKCANVDDMALTYAYELRAELLKKEDNLKSKILVVYDDNNHVVILSSSAIIEDLSELLEGERIGIALLFNKAEVHSLIKIIQEEYY